MDQSRFFPILWMNLLTHRHYTSPEGSSGAVERVTRSARARHSASPIMTTSAGASGRTSPAGTVPTAVSSPTKPIDAGIRGQILPRQHDRSRLGGVAIDRDDAPVGTGPVRPSADDRHVVAAGRDRAEDTLGA